MYTLAEDIPGIPEIPVNYTADVYVFKPKVGSILTGENYNLSSLVVSIF